jgi:hypothetical protein
MALRRMRSSDQLPVTGLELKRSRPADSIKDPRDRSVAPTPPATALQLLARFPIRRAAVLLKLIMQGFQANAEDFRGARLIIVGGFQRF